MKRRFIARTLGTLLVIGIILLVLQQMWIRFQVDPITRDGKVRADIVQITPDVSAWVTEVHMQDNEIVHKGQILLVLDRPRFQLAYDQAAAVLQRQHVTLAQAIREDRRNRAMTSLVALETIERGRELVDQLRASVTQSTAALNLAQLNLDRSIVYAPVDGAVTDMTIEPGDYVTTGKPAASLIYTKSLRIEAYFEETKMPGVHVGDRAQIQLMGRSDIITGHVESIAAGVIDRERDQDGNVSTLANINPAFTWVRLAQRIPVRVAIDHVPPGMSLVVGETATVEILPKAGKIEAHRSFPW